MINLPAHRHAIYIICTQSTIDIAFYLISLQVQAFIDRFNNKIATANCVHKGSFEKYQQRIG